MINKTDKFRVYNFNFSVKWNLLQNENKSDSWEPLVSDSVNKFYGFVVRDHTFCSAVFHRILHARCFWNVRNTNELPNRNWRRFAALFDILLEYPAGNWKPKPPLDDSFQATGVYKLKLGPKLLCILMTNNF